MGAPRFYVKGLQAGVVRLDEREADHARRSRRLSAGDEVALFDGLGREARGRIASAGRGAVDVAVESLRLCPRAEPALTLAAALPKGPRQDFLVEKCAELGVAGIVPLVTRRSVSNASGHRLDRWRRTAIEAAKQSGQAWIPDLATPELLDEAVRRIRVHDRAWVAMPGGSWPEVPDCGTLLAFVGPEGGWADDEIALLLEHGCAGVSLGPNVLRIETAAIALAALVHAARKPARWEEANP
ncbi:MAG: ribosomal RNA small subunit methyltransferase E [Phycisphaerae bacterium]